MSFSLRFLLILTTAVFSASVSRAVTWYSVASGNAETAAIWSLSTVGPGSTAAALGGFNTSVDLVVQSGYTVDLYTTGNININTLQVDAGGVFYSTNTTNRYINIYGNVICNGIIGGNGVYNSICFNIEGVNTVISGTGSFEASRMRKNAVLNPVSNLTIAMNMNLRWNSGTATQIYNNASATVFNVTINPGVTVNLISGNISIDGLSGNGFNEMSGTLTVNGTLNVSNALYMMTNNTVGGNSCNISIGSSGVIRTYQAVAGVSNVGGHNLLIAPGGKLELTGPSAFSSFSTNFNTYTCQPGSVVEYSYAGNQTVQTGLVYGHLYLSNSGVKTTNGNAVVQNDVLISGAAVLSPLNFSVSLQGNWINWGAAGMQEGMSTVIFNGNATQTITTAGGEQFFNCTVSKPTGTLDLNCNLNISGTFDFTSGIVNTTAVTLLHFLSGSAHVNASDLSFVSGPARKTGVSDFVFPVGKIGYLRPIGVFGLGANSVFTAEYFPADPQSIPTNVSALDPTIDHVSRCEYWSLTTPSFTEAFVSLTWNAATSCGVTSLSDLRVAQWETAIWRDRGNAGTSGTLTSGTILSSELLTSFGFFTLSSTLASQNPLPVEWLSFDVRKESESVILDWVTASEKNADYFEIQRSADGVNFESLSRVAAAGNSSVATYYTYSDKDPFKGSSYYRLRQVDTDGTVDFSEVRHVNFRSAVFEYQVHYNPSDGTVSIHLPEAESSADYRFDLISADGKVVFQENLRSSHHELSPVRLPAGIWFYRIVGSGMLLGSGRLPVF